MEPSSSQSTKPKTRWVNANYPNKYANKFAPKKSLKQYLPPTFIDLPADLTALEVDQFFREQRVDELTRKLRANVLELGDPDIRDPSPPPTYDPNGVKLNSREIRTLRTMEDEFGRLNRFLEKRVPGYMVPSDVYRPSKVYKKIQIPKDFSRHQFCGPHCRSSRYQPQTAPGRESVPDRVSRQGQFINFAIL